MNYARIGIAGLLCLLQSSVMVIASQNPVANLYVFMDAELTKNRFIASINDLTEDNYAYCVWAVKKDLEYCFVQEDATGCYPLEIIVRCYSTTVESDVKERYKNLFELFLRAGAFFAADLKNRLTEECCLKAQTLGAQAEAFQNLLPLLSNAFQAVRDKDIHALDALLRDHSMLVKMVDPTSKKTLLHEAARYFSSKDAASIQMFSHLLRKGADFEMPNGNGESVASLMNETHQASVLFKSEKEALEKQAVPALSFEEVKKAVQPVFTKLSPYKQQIGWSLLAAGLLWYLLSPRADKNIEYADAAVHLEQLA